MPTMTITTTAPQAARLAEALGRLLGLKDANGAPRDATAAEVKDHVIQGFRNSVHAYERQKATAAAVAGITDTAFDPS